MKMRRLISKQEFEEAMDDDYSHLYYTEPPLKKIGVSKEPFQSLASAFHSAGTYMDDLQQHKNQVGNIHPLCSQFPTHDPNILLCQSSQYNFSIDSSAHEKAGSNFEFRDTLQSLVKSHLCSSQCFSSSEKPNKIPCNHMIKPSPHAHNMLLLGENDALVRKQLSVPSDANHPGLNVCDSSSSRPTPSNKKRIRWTEDLHDQFVKTVDLLGGAEKNFERSSANGIPQLPMEISMQMKEALQLQLEVERRLHQQLEFPFVLLAQRPKSPKTSLVEEASADPNPTLFPTAQLSGPLAAPGETPL
ncbi:uncharacterized protein LOC132162198 [Corylus avellana]|uniref:uncharacterized protein LOC132162198 n=1 Tax=Corylus avellana TaxID=13451 RepID=UPI00286C9F9B|nr:uncharacterized protein LOC132162198 [Corylus avellana]